MIDAAALATYMFVMSITPGPNNVMLTASGANFGFRRTLPHMLGITGGFAAMTLLVCLGLGAVFVRVPQLQVGLTWLGAAYLVYIAWRIIGAGAVGKSETARPLSVVEAALFQPANPKGWITAITIAALFVPAHGNLFVAIGVIFALIIAVMFPSMAVWAAFGSAMRRFLDHPARRKAFNITMAALLAATAVMMLRTERRFGG